MAKIGLLIAFLTLLVIKTLSPASPAAAAGLPQPDSARDATPLIDSGPNILLLDRPPIDLFHAIPQRGELQQFGTLLLNDVHGSKVTMIVSDHTSIYEIAREIGMQWLKGDGKHPVTWNTLTSVLEEVKLIELAERINKLINVTAVDIPATPFAYSEQIINTATHLKELYSNQKVVEFDLLDRVGHNMPFLDIMVTVQGLDGDPDNETVSAHWKEFFEGSALPQRLLLTGLPGSGKTTLVRHLAKEWAMGHTLQSCEILFLIHLGRLKRRGVPSWNSLSDMLMSSHKDLRNVQCLAREINAKHGEGVCFLLDAYDEWHPDDYVYDLTFRNVLRMSNCILTSREMKSRNGISHVKIVGFNNSNLIQYLTKVANDYSVTKSVQNLWSAYPSVREMCVLPLHLNMIIFIVKHEAKPVLHTRSQIYIAFMNVTIKHYRTVYYPHWNTVSLRRCLLETSFADDLCLAFRTLHSVAFDILFKQVYLFPDHPEIQINLKALGFLQIEVEPSSSDEVRYTFSHPTFLEFFAVLHLTTLPKQKQLVYINLYGRCKNSLLSLYFELMLDLHPDHILGAGAIIKRSATQVNYWQAFPPICYFTYNNDEFIKTVDVVTHAWDSDDTTTLFHTMGIVSNSSLCVHDYFSINNFLTRLVLHKAQFTNRILCPSVHITLEDWNQALTSESFNALNACLSGDVNRCRIFPSVKAVRVESLDTYECSTQLFKLVHCCFPNLTLIHVKVYKDILPFIIGAVNLLSRRDIHTEITVSIDKCTIDSAVYLFKSLKLLQGIEGLHIISYCTYHKIKDEVARTYTDNRIHLSTLPQYHTLTLEGNLHFTTQMLIGQRSLRHLHLKGVTVEEFSELIQIIEANPNLETLKIANTKLQDGWKMFSQLKPPSTLVALNLDGNSLDDTFVVYVLSTLLQQLQYLQLLSLNDNKITDVGISVLIDTISNSMTNRSLHFLDLSNNPISDKHIRNFGRITSLRYLAFKQCQTHNMHEYYDDDIHLISQLFEDISHLQALHLCKSSKNSKDVAPLPNFILTMPCDAVTYVIPCSATGVMSTLDLITMMSESSFSSTIMPNGCYVAVLFNLMVVIIIVM